MVYLDNSGKGQLQVPGFNDIPLNLELPCQDRFTHGFEEWCQLPAVTLREFAMTAAMNWITDQDDWHNDISNARLAAWRSTVTAQFPLISEQAWDWCVAELQDKATFFRDKRFVEVLDAGSTTCKSDVLLPSTFAQALKTSLESAEATKIAGMDLVDPDFCPLVYGQTNVLSEGGTTLNDITAALYPAGHVFKAPTHQDSKTDTDQYDAHIKTFGMEELGTLRAFALQGDSDQYYWSSRYQALPCEVSFTSDHVTIDSYINNLHPSHQSAYSCLEDIIAASIEPWNHCLIRGGKNWRETEPADDDMSCINYWDQNQRGRKPLRIITFGVQWVDLLPGWAIAFDQNTKQELQRYQTSKASGSEAHLSWTSYNPRFYTNAILQLASVPEPDDEDLKKATEYADHLDDPFPQAAPIEPLEQSVIFHHLEMTARARTRWLQPEPGAAFSYTQWKTGQNVDDAVTEMDDRACGPSGQAIARPTHQPYTVCLQEEFREQGLQTVIKIGSIDLQPLLKPAHTQDWQLQGHMNEHIVASSLYIYDLANLSASISYRQETPMFQNVYRDESRQGVQWARETSSDAKHPFRRLPVAYGDVSAMCEMFGVPEDAMNCMEANEYLSAHDTGKIDLDLGRLVTWPNVLESCLSARLIDETQPGHLRYVLVNLVDPHYRICSTRNVPPQQKSWAESASPTTSDPHLPSQKEHNASHLSKHEHSMLNHRSEMTRERERLTLARWARVSTMGWYDF